MLAADVSLSCCLEHCSLPMRAMSIAVTPPAKKRKFDQPTPEVQKRYSDSTRKKQRERWETQRALQLLTAWRLALLYSDSSEEEREVPSADSEEQLRIRVLVPAPDSEEEARIRELFEEADRAFEADRLAAAAEQAAVPESDDETLILGQQIEEAIN